MDAVKAILLDRINALPEDQRDRLRTVSWTSGTGGPTSYFTYKRGKLMPADKPNVAAEDWIWGDVHKTIVTKKGNWK